MDIMDNMKNMGDMDAMKTRFEELKSKEQSGSLDDSGKQELQQLRDHFGKKDI